MCVAQGADADKPSSRARAKVPGSQKGCRHAGKIRGTEVWINRKHSRAARTGNARDRDTVQGAGRDCPAATRARPDSYLEAWRRQALARLILVETTAREAVWASGRRAINKRLSAPTMPPAFWRKLRRTFPGMPQVGNAEGSPERGFLYRRQKRGVRPRPPTVFELDSTGPVPKSPCV